MSERIPTEKHAQFNLKTMPPIFRRGEHVLILLKTLDNKYVLGAKKMYPTGIVRMVGGGLDEDIPPVGAVRELHEELGLKINPDNLSFLFTLYAHITASPNDTNKTAETVLFTTHVFYFELTKEVLKPASDLDGIAKLTEKEYRKLIQNYGNLSTDIDPIKHFAWADYGTVYGPVHEWALEAAKSLYK